MERRLCLEAGTVARASQLFSSSSSWTVWYASIIALDYNEREGGILEALALCVRWEALKPSLFLPSCWFKYQVSSRPAPLDQQTALASLFRVQEKPMFYLDSMWTLT